MDAEARNRELVAALTESGALRLPRIQEALLKAPRHLFVTQYYARVGAKELKLRATDERWRAFLIELVYQPDAAISLRKGKDDWTWTSSCSSPEIVCSMLESLGVEEGMHVLEVGTGSGWNAALLSGLAGRSGRVRTIEAQPDVAEDARRHLAAAGFPGMEVITGDGVRGAPDGAPYDRIIVTAACSDVAPAWLEQLAPGGRLLLPFEVPGLVSPLLLVRRDGDDLAARFVGHAEFMHLLGREAALAALTPRDEPGLLELLKQAPRVRPAPWAAEEGADAWSSRLSLLFYLHLTDPRSVAVQLEGGHWDAYIGLWDREKRGLALFGAERSLSYGHSGAYDDLLRFYGRWTDLRRPGIEDYGFRLLPADASIASDELGALRRGSIALAGRLVEKGPAGR